MDSTSNDVFADNTVPFGTANERENELSTKPPQCLIEIPTNPARKPLTGEEEKAAHSELIKRDFIKLKYPRERAFRNDPAVPQQRFGLITFMPSKGATPDSDGCFGVIKSRGNFASSAEAQTYGEMLISNHDSYSEIDIVFVGHDYPLLVDNTSYCRSTAEIDIRKKVEEVVKSHIKSKREEEKAQIKECEERAAILRDPTHQKEKDDAMDTQELYTKLRVKKASVLHAIDEYVTKLSQARKVLTSTDKEIEELEKSNPEVVGTMEYLNRFGKEMKAIGVNNPEQNPYYKYLTLSEEDEKNKCCIKMSE